MTTKKKKSDKVRLTFSKDDWYLISFALRKCMDMQVWPIMEEDMGWIVRELKRRKAV